MHFFLRNYILFTFVCLISCNSKKILNLEPCLKIEITKFFNLDQKKANNYFRTLKHLKGSEFIDVINRMSGIKNEEQYLDYHLKNLFIYNTYIKNLENGKKIYSKEEAEIVKKICNPQTIKTFINYLKYRFAYLNRKKILKSQKELSKVYHNNYSEKIDCPFINHSTKCINPEALVLCKIFKNYGIEMALNVSNFIKKNNYTYCELVKDVEKNNKSKLLKFMIENRFKKNNKKDKVKFILEIFGLNLRIIKDVFYNPDQIIDTCPICLKEFQEYDIIKVSCISLKGRLHAYHKKCLKECFKNNYYKCCLCKKNIKNNNAEDICQINKNYIITKNKSILLQDDKYFITNNSINNNLGINRPFNIESDEDEEDNMYLLLLVLMIPIIEVALICALHHANQNNGEIKEEDIEDVD